MIAKTTALENKVKVDPKEWIPAYGIYQIIKDKINDGPTAMDMPEKMKNINFSNYMRYSAGCLRAHFFPIWQVVSSIVTLEIAYRTTKMVYNLIEKVS